MAGMESYLHSLSSLCIHWLKTVLLGQALVFLIISYQMCYFCFFPSSFIFRFSCSNKDLVFPGGLGVKESVCNAGHPGLIPGIRWRREWLPTPVLLLENPMDRGTWQTTVPGVTKSRT